MKNFIPLLMSVSFSHAVFAQIPICQEVYVWDFACDNCNETLKSWVNTITDEFDNELSNQDCKVLERRDLGTLQAHQGNEAIISSTDLSAAQLAKLSAINAKVVVLGNIWKGDMDSEVHIKIRFINLTGTDKKSTIIDIPSEEMSATKKRREYLRQGILEILGKKPESAGTKLGDSQKVPPIDGGQKDKRETKQEENGNAITNNISKQSDWRWCSKCSGLFFASGRENIGTCPAGGQHEKGKSGNYSLSHNASNFDGQQDWRWCHKCSGLFHSAGKENTGKCPLGGQHEKGKSGNYGMWHIPNK